MVVDVWSIANLGVTNRGTALRRTHPVAFDIRWKRSRKPVNFIAQATERHARLLVLLVGLFERQQKGMAEEEQHDPEP